MVLNFDVFFNPEENLFLALKNASYTKALINYSAVPVILGILAGIVMLIGLALTGDMVTGIISLIGFPIIIGIGAILFAATANILLFIGMKLAGGKASFKDQFFGLSLIALPIQVALTIGYILLVISFVSVFVLIGIILVPIMYALIISLVLYIYYLLWVVIKEMHEVKAKRQIAGIAISLILLMIIVGLIIGLIILLAGTLMVSMLPALMV